SPAKSSATTPLLQARASPPAQSTRYFYFGYAYGSQAVFNPLTMFLNRGFDVLQVRAETRNIFAQSYGRNAANIARNLANPFSNIKRHGTRDFLREEIFPTTFTRSSMRWVPNYSLHLIGGGMDYAALREWYDAHRVPLPWLFSAATLLGAAFLNE